MSRAIHFVAYGTPKGQPRARACVRGNRAGVYDPGTANDWKSEIKMQARNKMIGHDLFTGPVELFVSCRMPRPKSHFKRNILRENAPSWVEKKPDVDNFAKAVMDALTNAQVWSDDKQVARLIVEKRYLKPGQSPHAWITIKELVQ